MKTFKPKTCEICGEVFEPSGTWQKYCRKKSCRDAVEKMRRMSNLERIRLKRAQEKIAKKKVVKSYSTKYDPSSPLSYGEQIAQQTLLEHNRRMKESRERWHKERTGRM